MGESTGGNQSGTEGQSGNAGGYKPDEQAKRSAADSYAQARQTITDVSRQAQRAASDWTQQACSATEAYVREKPWNALGIAAGIGLLVGLILRR